MIIVIIVMINYKSVSLGFGNNSRPLRFKNYESMTFFFFGRIRNLRLKQNPFRGKATEKRELSPSNTGV